ncbi:MAG: glycosyltransferase family 2 protein [Rhodoplanes sp.]|jgi:dolichol-phosphate mannosyltransferase
MPVALAANASLPELPDLGPVSVKAAPEITIVVPTLNERANIPILVARLQRLLAGVDWEIVFVDDNSADGTAAVARAIGEADSRVRCIRRIGRRGLAGALLEGMLSSQARWVAALDADLQHDETLLMAMVERLRQGDVDLVVASRYIDGQSGEGFAPRRARASRWSSVVARRFLGVELTDPMSGFFMIRRDTVEELASSLSSQGFKLLLDIVATARGKLRVVELPYVFRARQHGLSKLDTRVILDFAALVIAKLTNDAVSLRFLLFCFVGLTGVAVHMSALALAVDAAALRFSVAQAVATVVAITWNFVLNNRLTYRDQRLTGWRFLTGLLWFQAICSVGAVSNVGAASWIYDNGPGWWIAGLGGAVMGAVWNYVVSAAFVWRQR